MSQTSNPYGLSLFEYKGSNFSGTLANYPINPIVSVVGNDQAGFTSVGPVTYPIVGLCAGDLVTFGVSSTAPAVPAANWQTLTRSNGYIVGANSLYYDSSNPTFLNFPRAILGVFSGVQYMNQQNQNVRGTYWPSTPTSPNTPVGANSSVIATVNDLADCIFQVQCSGQLGATAAAAALNIGRLCGFSNNCSGNPSTGQSQLYLDVGTVGTNGYPNMGTTFGNTVFQPQWAPFRIIGLAPIQGNSWTDPYPDVLVMINNHMWKPGQPA